MRRVAFCIMSTCFVISLVSGCQKPTYGGLYVVERHQPELKIGYYVGNVATGDLKLPGTPEGQLLPIDTSTFPQQLKELVEPWNEHLVEFNAELNQFFPDQVMVSHPPLPIDTIREKPGYGLVKVANPQDPYQKYFQGGSTGNRFVAFALGTPQTNLPTMSGLVGGSAIYGVWDGQKTIEGFWFVATTLVSEEGMVVLGVKIPYTATMLIPEDQVSQGK